MKRLVKPDSEERVYSWIVFPFLAIFYVVSIFSLSGCEEPVDTSTSAAPELPIQLPVSPEPEPVPENEPEPVPENEPEPREPTFSERLQLMVDTLEQTEYHCPVDN